MPKDAGTSVVPLGEASSKRRWAELSQTKPGFAFHSSPRLCVWCRGHHGQRWQQKGKRVLLSSAVSLLAAG